MIYPNPALVRKEAERLAKALLIDSKISGVGEPNNLQYINESMIQGLFLASFDLLNSLDQNLSKNTSYLNLGHGGGFLEYINKFFSLDIQSSEWDLGDPFYKKIQDKLKVYPNYETTSILKSDFTIKDCKKTFDYFLIIRVPYKAYNDIVVNNIKKYSNGFIVYNPTKNDIRNIQEKFEKVKIFNENVIVTDF